MKEKICSFCGYRYFDDSLLNQVKSVISDLIENEGITTFYSGGMGNFDKACESVARELKQSHKYIQLCLVAPYMTKRLNTDREYYNERYDEIIIPDLGEVHYKRAITERNKWMADHSDVVLCYVTHPSGGASSLRARPFNTTFTRQMNTARRLYGEQLKLPPLTAMEIKTELEPLLEYYPTRDRGIICDRVVECIMTRQKVMV